MMPQFALRLAATAGDWPQLEQALLTMTGRDPPERRTVTSTYYDTASGRLEHDGLALQVRKENGQYTQIVARTDTKGDPSLPRHEWEDVIAGERPDLLAPNSSAHLPEALS